MAGLLALTGARTGHFALESGHHGTLWLDLDALFARPDVVEPYLAVLAARLVPHRLDAVCGPLTGGAFAAQWIARELGTLFVYSEAVPARPDAGLYARAYRVPGSLAPRVAGRRVAVVDDVVNAGSATRATITALDAAGASVVVAGALLTLGEVGAGFLAAAGIPLETLERRPNPLWAPADCPLCATGTELDTC